jgi:hypothetical protein
MLSCPKSSSSSSGAVGRTASTKCPVFNGTSAVMRGVEETAGFFNGPYALRLGVKGVVGQRFKD